MVTDKYCKIYKNFYKFWALSAYKSFQIKKLWYNEIEYKKTLKYIMRVISVEIFSPFENNVFL